MLYNVVILALSYSLSREVMWNLCKENSLLPSGLSNPDNKNSHWKMSKKKIKTKVHS